MKTAIGVLIGLAMIGAVLRAGQTAGDTRPRADALAVQAPEVHVARRPHRAMRIRTCSTSSAPLRALCPALRPALAPAPGVAEGRRIAQLGTQNL